ncbi:hypothetical protein BCR44DRAFT_1440676 [Catenaria anguillulae PL171]|uniref:Uncharacterized protein n=1 Tax=Catenaria anguillulae PL171 TaxID=765915 RepID=A0A1Y2HCA8_9FUNG|nr:hypothetical protein BCR44DRAFT_1440676 [Catenaria anguillulae PL171]
MSDRLAHFGRRAKRFVQGADSASPDPSASAWQPRDPSARPPSLTQLAANTADQPDAVEEAVLNEELPPKSDTADGQSESEDARDQQKPSATRGEGNNAGWNVRTLETSPKRGGNTTTQLKEAVKDKVKGILQRKGSADSSDSSASSEQDARDKQQPTICNRRSDPSSLRGSGSLTSASRSGLTSSTFSSSALNSGGSTLSYLARPALQALAALDEPDSTADLTLPWSGSMNIGGGASGTSSYASLRARQRELDRQDGEKEAVDIQLLASAALSGCSVVMSETDGPWIWSGIMAEVGDLLRMEPQANKEPGTGGKEGMVSGGAGNAMAALGAGTGRSRGLAAR